MAQPPNRDSKKDPTAEAEQRGAKGARKAGDDPPGFWDQFLHDYLGVGSPTGKKAKRAAKDQAEQDDPANDAEIDSPHGEASGEENPQRGGRENAKRHGIQSSMRSHPGERARDRNVARPGKGAVARPGQGAARAASRRPGGQTLRQHPAHDDAPAASSARPQPIVPPVIDEAQARSAPASPMEQRQLAALRRSGDLVDGTQPAAEEAGQDDGSVLRSLLGLSFANTDATELAARPADGLGPAI